MTDSLDDGRGVSTTTDRRVIILKLLALAGLLYLFILSITILGASFKLAGKGFAESIFTATSSPIVGLMIGLLATAVVQSSSTTTSIIVGLVASGIVSFECAIPMVMGANIGTTVTNTIVSMAHISRGDEFKRAFAGSVVHDFFNLCAVVILLPMQIYFNVVGVVAQYLGDVFTGFSGVEFKSPLAAIAKPLAGKIIAMTGKSAPISAISSVIMMFVALKYIVTVLKSLVLSKVERFFHRYIFRTPALGLILGIVLTILVQSSSITTSLVVPLLGAGVITLPQIFPYMLGANVGTTVTAFLASLVTGSPAAVSVAFAHLIFNVYGIIIFWPLKRIPIWMAEKLAQSTQKSKLFPILYIILVFFVLPVTVLLVMR